MNPILDPRDFNFNTNVNDSPKDLITLDSTVDIKPFTIMMVQNRTLNRTKKKPLMVLLDTGAKYYSAMKPEYGHLGKIKKITPITLCTPNNKFALNKSFKMQFFLREFSESKQINWTFNILPENSTLPYDFIIGRDLMQTLKMDILVYSESKVRWDDLRLPMREVKQSQIVHDFNALVEDYTPPSLTQSKSRWAGCSTEF